jgi:hypothetical protein
LALSTLDLGILIYRMEGGGKAGREERGGVSKEEGWTLTHLVSVTLAVSAGRGKDGGEGGGEDGREGRREGKGSLHYLIARTFLQHCFHAIQPRSCPSSPAPSLPPSSLLWVGGTLFYTTLTSVRCCLLAATIFAGKEEGGKEEEKKGGRGGGREGGGEEVAVLDMEVGSVKVRERGRGRDTGRDKGKGGSGTIYRTFPGRGLADSARNRSRLTQLIPPPSHSLPPPSPFLKAASPRADDAIAHGVSLQGRQDEEGGGRKGSGRCEWLPWLSTIPSLASTWFKQHSSSLPPSPQRASHLLLPHANASPAGAMAAAGTPPGAEGGKEGGREGGREVEAGEEKKGRKGSEGGRGPLLEAA